MAERVATVYDMIKIKLDDMQAQIVKSSPDKKEIHDVAFKWNRLINDKDLDYVCFIRNQQTGHLEYPRGI